MIPRIPVESRAGAWPSPATLRALARRVRRAARAMGCTREQAAALDLRIVDDARMRVLKQRTFGVAEATDVLSFPADAPLPGEDEAALEGLGSIVLNRDAVARQAARPGVSGWLDEATALAIHGVAHLRGHDHDRRDRARRMLACERRGSRAVGLPCTRPYGGSTPARARLVVPARATPWSEREPDDASDELASDATDEEPDDGTWASAGDEDDADAWTTADDEPDDEEPDAASASDDDEPDDDEPDDDEDEEPDPAWASADESPDDDPAWATDDEPDEAESPDDDPPDDEGDVDA